MPATIQGMLGVISIAIDMAAMIVANVHWLAN
jgi:hypothetical protein